MTKPEIRIIEPEDLSEVIEVQAKVWQDYFLTETNLQVPLIRRTGLNLSYYIDKEPEGCFVAVVGETVVGVIFSHVWGDVGWFGPVEVLTEMQGKGIGKALVEHSLQYMESRGCKTLGLETMASSVKNIAIYEKLGFEARQISHVFFKKLQNRHPATNDAIRDFDINDVRECRKLWEKPMSGLDYTVELESTESKPLGKSWAMETEKGLAHAIVHTYGMFETGNNATIKLLVCGENDVKTASELLAKCENTAIDTGNTGMFIRTYSATPPSQEFFSERGYLLHSNSIRMILKGRDEAGDTVHVSCWSG